MKKEQIKTYALLMKEWNLQSLTITKKDESIQLVRFPDSVKPEEPSKVEFAVETIEEDEEDDRVCITSPMIGVFYAAPAENAAPFVKEGDMVRKGDVLCIIEAMKLMNEIRAEKDGIVEKICVTNGQVVEYGTDLMWIKEQE